MSNQEKLAAFEDEFRFNLSVEGDELSQYLEGIASTLGVSDGCAMDIWYGRQRSWWKDEMLDELVRISNDPGEFYPNLTSGEFKWENGKFLHSV